jgi:hypothetical protein
VTVRITKQATTGGMSTSARWGQWFVLQRSVATGSFKPPIVEEFAATPAPAVYTFRGIGWEAAGIWHHQASFSLGSAAPSPAG